MPRKSTQSDLANYISGSQISLEEWRGWNVALSERGAPIFYLGYLSSESYGTVYPVSSASRREINRTARQFLRVERGSILADCFFHDVTRYRVLTQHVVHLPRANNSYFGVSSQENQQDESELTRGIFGATFNDLQQVLAVYSRVVDGPPLGLRDYPRITFSRTKHNHCDLTGVYIPSEYPYIAFEDSKYFRGHVSLCGFYRLLAFLCDRNQYRNAMPGNNFYQELIANGADQPTLDYMIESAIGGNKHLTVNELDSL